jgi:hypothetical protein
LHADTYRSVAALANADAGSAMPEAPLLAGATYPDASHDERRELVGGLPLGVGHVYTGEKLSRQTERHHGVPKEESEQRLWLLLRQSRQRWLSAERDVAAFLFGIVAHFCADALVPAYSESMTGASEVQQWFDRSEADYSPPDRSPPELPGAQLVQRALSIFLTRSGPTATDFTDSALADRRGLLHEFLAAAACSVTAPLVPPQLTYEHSILTKRLESASARFGRACGTQVAIVLRAATEAAETEAARRRWEPQLRLAVAKAWVLDGRTHARVTALQKQTEAAFRDTVRACIRYDEHVSRAERSVREFIGRADSYSGSDWYQTRELKQDMEECLKAFRLDTDAHVGSFDMAAAGICGEIGEGVVNACLQKLPADWSATFESRVVRNDTDVLLYLCAWVVVPLRAGLAVFIAWRLGTPLGPIITGALCITTLGAVVGLAALRRVRRWRTVQGYVERMLNKDGSAPRGLDPPG